MADVEQVDERRAVWLTVPNILCVIRGVGSLGLVPAAIYGGSYVLLGMYLVLASTDWVDGKIARWLNQRSVIGPRLDSIADATMYICLTLSILYLKVDVFLAELPWLAAGVGAYVVSCMASVIKFNRMPSYHTLSAKFGFFWVILAVVSILLGGSVWPLRIAMTVVTLANLEAIALTFLLDRPRSDVKSVFLIPEEGER